MNALDWITWNPSAAASLVSATIAASVAILVFAFTQVLTRRKERTQFLNAKARRSLPPDQQGLGREREVLPVGLPRAGRRCGCLQRDVCHGRTRPLRPPDGQAHHPQHPSVLPRLSKIHQRVFAAQRELNDLVFQLHTETPPDLAKVVDANGRVGHFLRLMEEEIIRNRDHLLSDHLLPKRYKDTSNAAIEAEIPPPNVPIMSPPLG
jgi:hypothetical protein